MTSGMTPDQILNYYNGVTGTKELYTNVNGNDFLVNKIKEELTAQLPKERTNQVSFNDYKKKAESILIGDQYSVDPVANKIKAIDYVMSLPIEDADILEMFSYLGITDSDLSAWQEGKRR